MARTLVLASGDTEYRVEVQQDGTVRFEDGGLERPPRRAEALAVRDVRWVFLDGETYQFHVERGARRRTTGHHGSLSAPMPATVIRVNVAVGDRVKRGETLVLLEAMKMELPVHSPSDAVIEAVLCREGELVQPGAILIELED